MTEKWKPTKWPGIYRDENDPDKYRVRVYDPRTRKYRQPRARSLTEAKRLHADLTAEAQRVDGAARRGRPPTVRQFGESWRTKLRHAPGSAVDLETALRLHVYPVLGDWKVTDVAYTHALDFVRRLERSADLAVSTQGKIDGHVRSLFTAVVAEGWRDRSPFDHVKRIEVPKKAKRRQREYEPTFAEALALAEAARKERRIDVWAWILLAIGTGLRGGELCGLAVEELDYPQPSRILVAYQLQYGRIPELGDRYVHYLKAAKSEAGQDRIVPLAGWLTDTIALLTSAQEPLRVTLPWVDDRGNVRGTRTVTLLFAGRYGTPPPPLQETVMARAVRALAERTGLTPPAADGDPDAERLRITPHTLRKVFTTLLDDAGVPLKARDYVTGHASEGITLSVYTWVTDKGLAKVRQAVQDAHDEAVADAGQPSTAKVEG